MSKQLQDANTGRVTHWMINIEESPARGQLVRLFDLLESSHSQEHADGRTQGKEIHRLEVQSVVDDGHLRRFNYMSAQTQTIFNSRNNPHRFIYLSRPNFKVIVVHMDRGDSSAHWKLLHSRIRGDLGC